MTVANGILSSAGEVLTLFLIPIGGGIPAGVILAKSRGIEWPVTTLLAKTRASLPQQVPSEVVYGDAAYGTGELQSFLEDAASIRS